MGQGRGPGCGSGFGEMLGGDPMAPRPLWGLGMGTGAGAALPKPIPAPQPGPDTSGASLGGKFQLPDLLEFFK